MAFHLTQLLKNILAIGPPVLSGIATHSFFTPQSFINILPSKVVLPSSFFRLICFLLHTITLDWTAWKWATVMLFGAAEMATTVITCWIFTLWIITILAPKMLFLLRRKHWQIVFPVWNWSNFSIPHSSLPHAIVCAFFFLLFTNFNELKIFSYDAHGLRTCVRAVMLVSSLLLLIISSIWYGVSYFCDDLLFFWYLY